MGKRRRLLELSHIMACMWFSFKHIPSFIFGAVDLVTAGAFSISFACIALDLFPDASDVALVSRIGVSDIATAGAFKDCSAVQRSIYLRAPRYCVYKCGFRFWMGKLVLIFYQRKCLSGRNFLLSDPCNRVAFFCFGCY